MNQRDGRSARQRGDAAATACGVMVLIVGVERSVRAVTQRMLERRGFRTLAAAGGDEALALFCERADEVVGVVLDLGMPGLDAENIFAELRRVRADVPILLTGGYGEDAVAAHLVGAGGTGFLAKPFGLEALGAKASVLFGSGRPSDHLRLSRSADALHGARA